MVYLEIDNRECSQSSVDCFSNTDEVASFLAAAHIKAQLRYPLVSVKSSKSFSSKKNLKMYFVKYSHNFKFKTPKTY